MVRAILNESPWRLRFKGESHITVALFPGDFPPKPAGRFEFATARAIGKFHLRHDQTGMSPAIDIELDQPVVPGNFVAHFSQSSASRARPECRELFRAQPDLAFFSMGTPTDLERQRCSVSSLPKADLSTGPFSCQITLLDNKASRPFQVVRQRFD